MRDIIEKKKGFTAFSIIFYIVAFALLIYATANDFAIDIELFNPQNTFVDIAESYGQFVYWGMWGIAFAIIFVCRHDLNNSLQIISNILPFVKPVENTQAKAYKFFDFIVKAVTTVGFFVLCGIGWKKLIKNVVKTYFPTQENQNSAKRYIS
ncbi:MAG: hypothetical protein LUG95_01555 [Clostridiales bacterium]|nr:hypothetical protein [Clostridiales bacterium]